MDSKKAQRKAAKQWNQRHPVGVQVNYWPGLRVGAPLRSKTITRAAVDAAGRAVVWVKGYGSSVALTHIEARNRDGGTAAQPRRRRNLWLKPEAPTFLAPPEGALIVVELPDDGTSDE